MPHCTSCGSENPPEQRFCTACGEPLLVSSAALRRPSNAPRPAGFNAAQLPTAQSAGRLSRTQSSRGGEVWNITGRPAPARVSDEQMRFAQKKFTELDEKYGSRCYLEVNQLEELWETLVSQKGFFEEAIEKDLQSLQEFIPQLIQEIGSTGKLNFKAFLDRMTRWQRSVVEIHQTEEIAEKLGQKALTGDLTDEEKEELKRRVAQLEAKNRGIADTVKDALGNLEQEKAGVEQELEENKSQRQAQEVQLRQAEELLKKAALEKEEAAERAQLEREKLTSENEKRNQELKAENDAAVAILEENEATIAGLREKEERSLQIFSDLKAKHKKKKNDLKDQLKKANEKIVELEKENQQLKDNVTRLEADIASFKKEREALLNSSEESTQALVAELNSKLEFTQTLADQREQHANTLQLKINANEQQLKELNSILEEATQDHEKKEALIKEKDQQITTLQGQINTNEQQIKDLSSKLEEATKQQTKLETELTNLTADSKQKQETLQKSLDLANQELESLQNTVNLLKADASQAGPLNHQIVELKLKLEEKDIENREAKENYNDEIKKFKRQTEDAKKSLENELNALKKKNEEKEKEWKETKSKLQAEIVDLKKLIEEADSSFTELEHQLSEFQKAAEEREKAVTDSKKAFEDDFEEFKKQTEEKEKGFKEAKKNLEDEFNEYKKQSEEKEKECRETKTSLRDELAELKKQLEEAEKKAKNEKQQFEKEIAEVKDDLKIVSEKKETIELQNSFFANQVEDLQAQIEKLKKSENEGQVLQGSISDANSKISNQEGEIAKLKKQVTDYESEDKKLKKIIEELEEEVQDVTTKFQICEGQKVDITHKYQAEVTALESQLNALKKQSGSVENTLATVSAEKQLLEKTLNGVILDLQEQLEHEKDNYEELHRLFALETEQAGKVAGSLNNKNAEADRQLQRINNLQKELDEEKQNHKETHVLLADLQIKYDNLDSEVIKLRSQILEERTLNETKQLALQEEFMAKQLAFTQQLETSNRAKLELNEALKAQRESKVNELEAQEDAYRLKERNAEEAYTLLLTEVNVAKLKIKEQTGKLAEADSDIKELKDQVQAQKQTIEVMEASVNRQRDLTNKMEQTFSLSMNQISSDNNEKSTKMKDQLKELIVECEDLKIEKQELERQRNHEMAQVTKYKELAYQRLNEAAEAQEKLHTLTQAFNILKDTDEQRGIELDDLRFKLEATEEELQGEKEINITLRKEIADLKENVTAKEFKSITDVMHKFKAEATDANDDAKLKNIYEMLCGRPELLSKFVVYLGDFTANITKLPVAIFWIRQVVNLLSMCGDEIKDVPVKNIHTEGVTDLRTFSNHQTLLLLGTVGPLPDS